MRAIEVLDKQTIDQIAAGEVVERPASVIKELTENAIDAGATAVTIEIRDGGTTFMRITDNGAGIPANQVKKAFLRHATSKIRKAGDLVNIASLGFRGEALSSISAVAQVECITKTPDALTGVRYRIEGGEEKEYEEIGAPGGTTFIVRNLFFNTPARAKFLKSPVTEGNHVSTFVEELALSHPEISFKYIQNGQNRLYTSGNGNLKEIVYQIFGRDLTKELIPVDQETEWMHVHGFIGNPNVARGNRSFENYFVNGRYVKSKVIAKAIEDAYHGFLMQHKYPFTLLYLDIACDKVDVNVHPQKLEVRISDQEGVYHRLCLTIQNALMQRERIPEVPIGKEKTAPQDAAGRLPRLPKGAPEPFERAHRASADSSYSSGQTGKTSLSSLSAVIPEIPGTPLDALRRIHSDTPEPEASAARTLPPAVPDTDAPAVSVSEEENRTDAPGADGRKTEDFLKEESSVYAPSQTESDGEGFYRNAADKETQNSGSAIRPEEKEKVPQEGKTGKEPKAEQLNLFTEDKVLSEQARSMFRLIGQVFDTYWLIEYRDALYIIDQHAAHEKVNYERMMKNYREKKIHSQMLYPSIVLDLSRKEAQLLENNLSAFTDLGFEVEAFGGTTFKINAVPANLYSVASDELFLQILSQLESLGEISPKLIPEKLASMSCKAAVKGNNVLSVSEANALIDELLKLENPYNCPHGRPTIISMTRYEMDRKFKRIV